MCDCVWSAFFWSIWCIANQVRGFVSVFFDFARIFFVLILLNCVLIGSNFNFDFVLNFVRFFGKDDFDIDC